MIWKIFIAACLSSLAILFPANIIGCSGDEPDPYDYYTGFFHHQLAGEKAFEPFYYTNYQFLYKEEEPVDVARVTAAEWTRLAPATLTENDAYDWVCRYSLKDLTNLYNHLEKKQALNIPDSVRRNPFAQYFIRQKNLEALGYLLFAKKVEPYVTSQWNEWEENNHDSVSMAKLGLNGLQLMAAAKSDFIKLRYAYQATRLALYNNQPQECIRLYEKFIQKNPETSVLKELGLALKAGAYFRTGQRNEAAYLFSQLFANSKLKRISNYLSFDWCVKRMDAADRQQQLVNCKTEIEKANMLSLFALGSNEPEIEVIRQVYQLAPASPLFPVLLTREVNKLEEFVFSADLQFAKDRKTAFIGYTELEKGDATYERWRNTGRELLNFCIVQGAANKQPAPLLKLAAAHTAYLLGDYTQARQRLNQIKKQDLTTLQKDQWALSSLLVTINSRKEIDAGFEQELVPALKWLETKAAKDEEFAKFFRRIFADILAEKYRSQTGRNSAKYLLCLGVADGIQEKYLKSSWGYSPQSIGALQNNTSASQAEWLVSYLESKTLSTFEQYLVKNSIFNRNEVNDLVGTCWLRQLDFAKAEKWLAKLPAGYYRKEPFNTYLAANPFADLLLDTHGPTAQDTVRYDKLKFTRRMKQLETAITATSDADKKARYHYELAKGLYQMSYWGNSWMLQAYYWSTMELEEKQVGKDYGPNPKEYYELASAKTHYLKALAASSNTNLQAKCLFMAAKCDQKQVGNLPWLYNFGLRNDYQKALNEWLLKFDKHNAFFSQLSQHFSRTPFYQEAYNTCSYLRDFVRIKK